MERGDGDDPAILAVVAVVVVVVDRNPEEYVDDDIDDRIWG